MSFFDPVARIVELGGPVVALLLVISVIALALIVLKLIQFYLDHVGRHGTLDQAVALWHQGRVDEAKAITQGNKCPAASGTEVAINFADMGLPVSEIEEEVSRITLGHLHELQKGFRALDAIAQIAPLLGLFGTVLGMISAFQELQSAGNAVDPSALAGGIWVALMTTAVGLAVAMPVSLMLTYFESRVENERIAVERLTGAVLSKHYGKRPAKTSAPEMANAAPA